MRRVVVIAIAFGTGCLLDRADPVERFDRDLCDYHTATIFSPQNGETVPGNVAVRVRWNQSTPDRYTSMTDDFSNYFIPSGGDEIMGDGSIVSSYSLPAGGTFNFEIGWICVQGSEWQLGETIPLAAVRFRTQP